MLITLLIAKFLHHSLYNIISIIVWFEVKKQVMKYNNTLEYINLM